MDRKFLILICKSQRWADGIFSRKNVDQEVSGLLLRHRDD